MKRHPLQLVLALTVVLSLVWHPASAGASPGVNELAAGRILVKFKAGAAEAAQKELSAMGTTVAKDTRPLGRLAIKVVYVPAGKEKEYADNLKRRPDVEFAEPDYRVTAQFIPNDPLFPQQWNLTKVKAPDAWDRGSGNGVVVAVIDTGIDELHPDLVSQIVTPTTVLTGTTVHDGNGHGTHVAGIVAAATNNGKGVAGMAFGAKVMPIKALYDDGTGYYSDVADAIVLAANEGAKVINLSLGGPAPSQTLSDAVAYALSRGALVFAAAGNSGASHLVYPAAIPGVVAVGSTSSSDARSPFSNYGSGLGVVAPGENILSTVPCPPTDIDPTCGSGSGSYGYKTGTSMATPLAAGLAALIWSLRPQLNAEEVKAVLQGTAVDLGTPGWDAQFGYGRIDAAEAAESLACLNESATYYLGPIETAWGALLYSWASAGSSAQLYSASGSLVGNLSASGSEISSFSGWPNNFTGYLKLTAGACSNPLLLAAPGDTSPGLIAPATAMSETAIPLRTGSGFEGGVYLINTSSTANQVTLAIHNTLGELVHQVETNLSAHEARQLSATDLGLSTPGWVWIEVNSSQPLATYGYWRRTFGTPVYFPAKGSATDQQMAAVRRGADGWASQVWLVNPNDQPAQVNLRFQGRGRTVRTLVATLPPKGFAVADSGRVRLPVGWEGTAHVTSDRPVYAFNIMYKSSKRQVAVLGAAALHRTYHSPAVFKNWYGWYTSLRGYNVGEASIAASFRIMLDGLTPVVRKDFAPVGGMKVIKYAVASSSALGNPFAGGVEIFSGAPIPAVVELSRDGRTFFYSLR